MTTQQLLGTVNPLECRGNYSAALNNEVGTLAVDGWAVTYGTAKRKLGGATPHSPLVAVPYITAHPSAASVPITVLLYSNPLLCGFNVPMKELKIPFVHSRIQLSTFCNALLITYDI